MAAPAPTRIRSFASAAAWGDWLGIHHASEPELWVKLPKGGLPGPSWEEAVIEALVWGWVDGVKGAGDAGYYLQRFTPRRKASNWSQRNRAHAERLIATGRMQPPGLVAVAAARAGGRWETAYAGQATMVIPADFLEALAAGPEAARKTFAGLNRATLFAIYHRLTTAKRPETRAKRITQFVAMLARGKTFH